MAYVLTALVLGEDAGRLQLPYKSCAAMPVWHIPSAALPPPALTPPKPPPSPSFHPTVRAVAVLAACCFPLAPNWAKVWVFYASASLLILLLGLLALRGALALATWLVAGRTVWLLPNALSEASRRVGVMAVYVLRCICPWGLQQCWHLVLTWLPPACPRPAATHAPALIRSAAVPTHLPAGCADLPALQAAHFC